MFKGLRRKSKLERIRSARKKPDFILKSTNSGIKLHNLARMPGVVSVSHDAGWTTYVDIRMRDGWTGSWSTRFYKDPFACAARAAYRRFLKRETC